MNSANDEKIILLIDQNDHDVKLFAKAAKRSCKARIQRVASGQQAVDYLIRQQSVAQTLPKLIIIEWDLPSADGFSVLRFVNGTPILKTIPTIILTRGFQPGTP